MLGEEDGLDRRAAARARLALALVDLQRHRQLVGELLADHLLVVVDRVAEHVERLVQALDLLGVELGALAEGRQPRLPEDLVDPGAADAGDRPLVAQQRMQVARLVDQRRELLERRRGPGLGPERRDHLVLGDRVRRQQLRPGPLLGAELAQPQLAPVLEPDQEPRGPVAQRGPLVEDLQPPGRHQVDQQRQVAELDDGHLADPAHAR